LREATRLTRAGRVVEATALLQHMLRGERTTDPTLHTDAIALPQPSIVDVKANWVKTEDSEVPRATSAEPRKAQSNRTNNYPGLGLPGKTTGAPPPPRAIEPE